MSHEPHHTDPEEAAPPSERHADSSTSDHDRGSEPPVDLMVTSRARRPNAGNRMSTLLAKSAEEEQWGEEWEEADNEEEFQEGNVNEQEDYNMDSSSSEEDEGRDDDDQGEKELRKAERQEKSKKRKAVTNPFAARVAAAARKKVKLDVPNPQSSMLAPPRPKKKSERASWIPTEEDGPVRTSSRKQTVANKETTLAKLKEKDRRRDDTLAMMKAAEARKAKAKEKPPTQAERLAEAARNERVNKKTLHRWEEAEEARAAERQAKIDALKNREMDGPFIRYYSGPAIWVDEKLKYIGKDAPTLEHLEEKLNKEVLGGEAQPTQSQPTETQAPESTSNSAQATEMTNGTSQPPSDEVANIHTPLTAAHVPPIPTTQPSHQDTSILPWTNGSRGEDVFMGGDVFMGSHGMPYPSSVMFAPPSQDSLLPGIDQYATSQQTQTSSGDLPPNPFTQALPFQQQYATSHQPFSQPQSAYDDPLLTHYNSEAIGPQALLSQFQRPPLPPPSLPPPPPRRKVIHRALRNLLILSSFPHLDNLPPHTTSSSSSRIPKSAATALKDRDRTALIHVSATLFHWSLPDATAFVTTMLAHSSHKPRKKDKDHPADGALKPHQKSCPITNAVARYRDPETGIPYRDARAFGVLRGVVGGGFVWSADLACYVGGRAKPLESMQGGKGFLGMPPCKNVPRRFWESRGKVKDGGVGAGASVGVGVGAGVSGRDVVGDKQKETEHRNGDVGSGADGAEKTSTGEVVKAENGGVVA
ncbi:hypothetical protein ACN47E_007247 [Coniothyrium glycines]